MDDRTINNLIKSLGDNTELDKDYHIKMKDIAYHTLVSSGEDVIEDLTLYLSKNMGLKNRDVNQEVANIVMDICEVYGNKTPLEVFIKASQNSVFKLEAIRSLGFIDDKKSYDTLVSIINNPREQAAYKSNAVSALGDLSKYDEKGVLKELNDIMDKLEYKGDPRIDNEIKIVKNNIIATINKIMNKESYETIGELLEKNEI